MLEGALLWYNLNPLNYLKGNCALLALVPVRIVLKRKCHVSDLSFLNYKFTILFCYILTLE